MRQLYWEHVYLLYIFTLAMIYPFHLIVLLSYCHTTPISPNCFYFMQQSLSNRKKWSHHLRFSWIAVQSFSLAAFSFSSLLKTTWVFSNKQILLTATTRRSMASEIPFFNFLSLSLLFITYKRWYTNKYLRFKFIKLWNDRSN